MLKDGKHIVNNRWIKIGVNALLVIFALFLFFFSINFISASFQNLSKESIDSIWYATNNPFIGLFIGLLLTALIQSSSTSTSMIVAIVAAGTITIENAAPMIMGANIGTTLTSSLVALSYVNNKRTFRRAISAGVTHDFFNILLTMILFPLELVYGILSRPASLLGQNISQWDIGVSEEIKLSLSNEVGKWAEIVADFIPNNVITAIVSFIILLLSVKLLSQIIYRQLIGKSRQRLNDYFFRNNFQSFSSGLLVTAAIQSSSITTSLIVPVVANRKISLKRGYPFILGANLGTTLTALLAAIFKNEAALSIAILHFLFNLYGIILFLFIPYLRNIAPFLAKQFAFQVQRYRYIGFTYVLLIFFLIPFSLIYFNKDSLNTQSRKSDTKIIKQHHENSIHNN